VVYLKNVKMALVQIQVLLEKGTKQ